MSRALSIVIAAGVLLLAGTACRDQQREEQQPGQQPGTGGAGKQDQQAQGQQQKEQTITGRVASVDRDSLTVLDTRRNEVVELKVPGDAQVMREGQRISVEDISEGAEVRASYTMDRDQKVVRSLTVTSEPRKGQQQQREQEQPQP